MSYADIRAALVDRIEAVDPTAKVYDFFRWTDEAAGMSAWLELYGTPMNAWQITRTNRVSLPIPGDDLRRRVHHTLAIWHHRAHNDATESENAFQDAVDEVLLDLEEGDRTLGGVAITHTLPELQAQADDFTGVLCHVASIRLIVEEIVTVAPGGSLADPPASDNTPNTSRALAVGNALVAFANASLGSLGLESCAWQKGMAQAPIYPADPRNDLPKLELRAYVEQIDAGVSRSTRTVLHFTWWYYRLQVPGEEHQQLLRDDLETIVNRHFGNFNPTQLEIAGADFTRPAQTVVRDELTHPIVDDPSLRVSVGEISMEIACIGQA